MGYFGISSPFEYICYRINEMRYREIQGKAEKGVELEWSEVGRESI